MRYTINATGHYIFDEPVHPDKITEIAESIIRATFNRQADVLSSPDATRNYCVHRLAKRDREVFMAIWLNNRHQVIEFEELAVGTIDGASVFPREVVISALKHKAAAVIFAHQHPSGVPEPSGADRRITRRLIDALALIDIRVLDHLIVAGTCTVSFAERGLL